MTTDSSRLSRKHRFAQVSLAISALDVLVIMAVVHFHSTFDSPKMYAERIAVTAWIYGSLSSVLLAIVALIVETNKKIPLISLTASILTFYFLSTLLLH